MIAAEIPSNEQKRLKDLQSYNILDSLPEKEYNEITELAAKISGMPISMISLVDAKRQWFKSTSGTSLRETPRDIAFCAHAILHSSEAFLVPDSYLDERFANNPLVIGEPKIRFYAGIPLVNDQGSALGTLCVVDHKPNQLDKNQIKSLELLGKQIIHLLEIRKKYGELELEKKDLELRYEELEKFSRVVSHDIKSPLNNMIGLIELLSLQYDENLPEDGKQYLQYLKASSTKLKDLVDGILAYYKGEKEISNATESIQLNELLLQISKMINASSEFSFVLTDSTNVQITANRSILERVFLNLLVNSVKYNHKAQGVIEIDFSESDSHYHFVVKDNGDGIPKEDLNRIFNLFTNLGNVDRFGNLGSGMGLATVRKLIQYVEGTIQVDSQVDIGTTFTFTYKK